MFLDNKHSVVLRMMKATCQSGTEIGQHIFLEPIHHAGPYPKIEGCLRQRVVSGTWVGQCSGRISFTVASRQCGDSRVCSDFPALKSGGPLLSHGSQES